MTNHIGPLGPKITSDPPQKVAEEPGINTDQKNSAPQNITTASPQASRFMEAALERLRQLPVVDTDKVAAAKEKVASGQLGILQTGEKKSKSAESIADALLNLDSILPKG